MSVNSETHDGETSLGRRTSKGAIARTKKRGQNRTIYWTEWVKVDANPTTPMAPVRRSRVGLPEHVFPACVVKSMRRQQQRRRDKRWDGLATKTIPNLAA